MYRHSLINLSHELVHCSTQVSHQQTPSSKPQTQVLIPPPCSPYVFDPPFPLAPHPFFLFFAWQLKLRGQEGIWEAITVVCFGSLTPTPSPWLCRSNAATLPACCLGNKHIFNHPGPASAKATLAEPCLTSSGQKSWTAI